MNVNGLHNFWLLVHFDGLSMMSMDASGQRISDLGTLHENFIEVLSVRWFSFHKALETTFHCYASLLTFHKMFKICNVRAWLEN